MNKLDNILDDVRMEFTWATTKWKKFNSLHEAYAIVLEEMDELWDYVKLSQKVPDYKKGAREEAIQVAAMAIRLIHDCCDV